MQPRPRLVSTAPLYDAVGALADLLDAAAMDLWAANLRSCLHGATGADRLTHLGLELHRLRQSPAARRLGLLDRVDRLIVIVETAIGAADAEALPVYVTLRDLADLLELEGGRRWLRALRAAGVAPRCAPAEQVARVRAVLDRMVPGTPGVPPGGGRLVAAVRQRLDRSGDPQRIAGGIVLALQPPA